MAARENEISVHKLTKMLTALAEQMDEKGQRAAVVKSITALAKAYPLKVAKATQFLPDDYRFLIRDIVVSAIQDKPYPVQEDRRNDSQKGS